MSSWKSRSDFRMGVFLLLLFWGLLYMHAAAAIGQDYCVFCFTPYIAFFNVAGILLLVVTVKSWDWRPSLFRQILLIICLLVIFTGIGFSAFEDVGSSLLKLPMPRIRDFGILPGFVTLWDILSNKFHVTNNDAMRYISTVFGFAAGVLMLLVGYLVWHRTQLKSVGFASFFASTILLLSLFFSPVLHGSAGTKDCSSNVILSNEQIGSYLRGIIPVGSLVYWFGGLSAAPLLYLPEVNIFPAQINDGYSFISHGNTAELFKFGLWNEEMDANWKATADYFIIEDNRYNGWKEFFNPQQFDEFARSPVRTSCNEGSSLLVFRRK